MIPENKIKYGIVGGGMLGLTIAYRLAQQGYDVTLFEAEEQLGGLASSWKLNDITWDRYYHVILLSDCYTRSLLNELGLEKEIEWVETKTGFYSAGQLYSMSNTMEFLKFPPLSLIDKIRLGKTIFYVSRLKNWKRLEKISVENWLRKWSGNNTFNKIWQPLLRAKLGEAYNRTSAAFIWATIARMYSARRSGLKKEMFGYVPGGYARILKQFVEVLENKNVTVKSSCSVNKVEPTPYGRVRVKFDNEHFDVYDQVIVTTPSPIAKDMCGGLTQEEKKRHDEIHYSGVICAGLLLRKPLSKFYVTNITDDWLPFTGVIEMSALADQKYFNGNSLVYLPKYVTSDDSIFQRSDQEIEQQFTSALMKMHSHLQLDDILCFRVARAKYVFALPTLNYSDKLPSMATSIPGVYIINSAHIVNGTLNVNETIKLADRALTDVLLPTRFQNTHG